MKLRRSTIRVADLEVELTRKRMKSITIRVYPPDGVVRVSAPRGVPDRDVHAAILARLAWIRHHQARLRALPPRLPAPPLTEEDRARLVALARPLMERWARVIGVVPRELRTRRMRTRWGSCNIEARRIWLNLELARHSEELVEYVLVHELVHLLERYHNARFYGLMDRFLPDWRDRRAELNRMAP